MTDDLHPGLYELLVTRDVESRLAADGVMPPDALDERSPEVLGRHVGNLVERVLRDMKSTDPAEQVAVVNRLLGLLREQSPQSFDADGDVVVAPARELTEVAGPVSPTGAYQPLQRPAIPLSDSALLVNGRGEPAVGNQLNREISSADRVDVLIPFVRWTGVRIIRDQLAGVIRRGGAVRVIASTYLASSEAKALEALIDLGAAVRVSYDTGTTRMHAKAWLFERNSGFSTALIGSSNLSRTALLDGVEWNVRLSGVENPGVLDTFRATFESYWNDPQVDPYDAERFAAAMQVGRNADDAIDVSMLDVTPRPFQQKILEALDVERRRHDQHSNLVVSATGTGKTVMAALDYKRLRDARGGQFSLLFVAHRQEILRQSQRVFRDVLKDGAFGELYVDGERPREWSHVFASVQSLRTGDLDSIDPAHFDMVIIDEFHHGAAPTYRRLLDHFRPQELLGLTATPERTDGKDQDILDLYFDGRFAAELRLWDAIDGGMLCPFQYFGIHDDVDLSKLKWSRGHYDATELDNLYTGNDIRVAKVLAALRDIVADSRAMKALGFCVSVAHAQYMARTFEKAGIPSVAVWADTPSEGRDAALKDLRAGRINCVFAVDLFNEGVDVPSIDTVIFLRPTESATVFLQQLGRGLRHAEGKACLTVLDFIGNQHKQFRFERRLRALLPNTGRTDLEHQIEEDFPFLPAGCFMTLDRVARDVVLKNIRSAIRGGWKELVDELREAGDVDLSEFLRISQREPWELYRSNPRAATSRGGWMALHRAAGLSSPQPLDGDDVLVRAMGRMTHINDAERLHLYIETLRAGAPPPVPVVGSRKYRLLTMLHYDLWKTTRPLEDGLAEIWRRLAVREELLALLPALDARATLATFPWDASSDIPLHIHGMYTREETLAALGLSTPEKAQPHREGVLWHKDITCDFFFVTLEKDDRKFSESTRYNDVALSPTLFQWESQSTTTQSSPTGRRYINHERLGSRIALFIRRAPGDPFLFAGPARYVLHEGDRPIRFRWKLDYPLPELIYERTRAVA